MARVYPYGATISAYPILEIVPPSKSENTVYFARLPSIAGEILITRIELCINIELGQGMKKSKKTEDLASRRRLRRKVLERWENEGGKICTDPGETSQSDTPPRQGTQTSAHSQVRSAKKSDPSAH